MYLPLVINITGGIDACYNKSVLYIIFFFIFAIEQRGHCQRRIENLPKGILVKMKNKFGMEIQIFDTKGKMVAERHYFPGKNKSEISYLIDNNKPGVYIVNILVDNIVKTRKMKLR